MTSDEKDFESIILDCPCCKKSKTLQENFEWYVKQNPGYDHYLLNLRGYISSDIECTFESYIKINDQDEFTLRMQNGLLILLGSKPIKWDTQAILAPEDKIEFMGKADKDVEITLDAQTTFVGL